MSHRPRVRGRTRCLVWSAYFSLLRFQRLFLACTRRPKIILLSRWDQAPCIESSLPKPHLVETVLFSSVGWECSSEHGPLAYRLFFRRFILNDVPMLDQNAALDANDVRRNPVHGQAET